MTGRFSCSNPNLQQIPKKEEFRELFEAPEGRVLIAADFSGIELRIMAWLSQDERMIQAFQEGIDLHRLTASAVTGKEISEVTNEERQAAKAINFALIYGGSAKTLRNYARVIYGVEMSIEEAERAVKTFFANYLQVAEWHKIRGGKRFNPETHWFYESGKGFLTKSLVGTRTASGRKRIWPYYAGETRATTMQLFNTPCQGTGADIVKKAMIDFYRALLERNWNNVYLVGTVHDELLVEVPQELVHEVTSLLIQKMEAAGEDFIWPVPVKVEVK
jgi:DNA polymerase-1